MKFANIDKLKTLAIVNVFETSKPFGDYAACVVLNDGAGISYGISQFTHRSGSLLAVVEKYLANGGVVGRRAIEESLPLLQLKTATAINSLAANRELKSALRAAAITSEMRAAQDAVVFERYLGPATGACEEFGFELPLSLAVIYDSMTHGSWERIGSRVRIRGDEKAWITEYVRIRDRWLDGIPRLRSTRYRTRFFLDQIATGNWDLRLPVYVHGIELTDEMFRTKDSAVEPIFITSANLPSRQNNPPGPSTLDRPFTQAAPPDPQAQPPDKKVREDYLDEIERWIYAIAERYDRIEAILNAVLSRTDAAKSLWTTIAGTVWQTAWAIFAFLSGMPKALWLAAALIVGALTLFYLYRQIALGKIRERTAVNNTKL